MELTEAFRPVVAFRLIEAPGKHRGAKSALSLEIRGADVGRLNSSLLEVT
jgi:hypothetical protein